MSTQCDRQSCMRMSRDIQQEGTAFYLAPSQRPIYTNVWILVELHPAPAVRVWKIWLGIFTQGLLSDTCVFQDTVCSWWLHNRKHIHLAYKHRLCTQQRTCTWKFKCPHEWHPCANNDVWRSKPHEGLKRRFRMLNLAPCQTWNCTYDTCWFLIRHKTSQGDGVKRKLHSMLCWLISSSTPVFASRLLWCLPRWWNLLILSAWWIKIPGNKILSLHMARCLTNCFTDKPLLQPDSLIEHVRSHYVDDLHFPKHILAEKKLQLMKWQLKQ